MTDRLAEIKSLAETALGSRNPHYVTTALTEIIHLAEVALQDGHKPAPVEVPPPAEDFESDPFVDD